MEKEQVSLYDILTNKLTGKSGVVIEIQPWKTEFYYESGETAQILAAYFEPADAETCARLAPLKEKRQAAPGNRLAAEHGEKQDPKEALAKHFQKQIVLNPAAEHILPLFWGEVLSVVGDQPGKTWDMRWRSVEHFCPVINAKNLSTQNWGHCFYILTGSTIRLEIKKDLLPEEDKELFPILNTMYGTCNAVEYEYSAFDEKTRAKYLACLRKIYARH